MNWMRIVRKFVIAAAMATGALVVSPAATLQAQGCQTSACQFGCAFDCYYSLTCGQVYGNRCNQTLYAQCEDEACVCIFECVD